MVSLQRLQKRDQLVGGIDACLAKDNAKFLLREIHISKLVHGWSNKRGKMSRVRGIDLKVVYEGKFGLDQLA